MGDLFGVTLHPGNRWGGGKVLRERWQTHIDAAFSRAVLIVDGAQGMVPVVLSELRLLASARLDSHIRLTVAAGTTCLRPLSVPRFGRVLLYAAEDVLHVVRQRLEGIRAAAGLGLADLDVNVITAPTVRLDLAADRQTLDETVAKLAPRLVDPFVRLHRIDENASDEVAPLLIYLRTAAPLPWSSCTTPRRVPAAFAPAKPCAAHPSSTLGRL